MFVVALIAALVVLGVFVTVNLRRIRTPFEFELQPNCLLTRYPLLFISGPRSLFYFGDYWNRIPHYLRAHGYEVMELNLPSRNPLQRHRSLQNFITQAEANRLRLHIIGESSCAEELGLLSAGRSPVVQSCSAIVMGRATPATVSPSPRVEDLRPNLSLLNQVELPETQLTAPSPSRLWTLLLSLHNWINRPEKSLDPVAVALPEVSDRLAVAQHYLKLAISLAESDLKCSH